MAERIVPKIELNYKPTGKRDQERRRSETAAYDLKLQWKHAFLF
jgi:hypothetical protein